MPKLITVIDTKRVEIELGDRFIIGRSPQCDLVLNDNTVSRIHATLILDWQSRRHIINDGQLTPQKRSANGVFVNAVRHKTTLLKHGDLIMIGVTELEYVCRIEDDTDPSKKTQSNVERNHD